MTGSKTNSMTLEEMRAARARGESKTERARLRREQAAGIEPAPDEDSPDATPAMRELIRN
ncbi:MAG: hypothetical protein HY778_06195 [Betaproteobacteria bacterium]|nr:hypothetical protein [Betaproteobacteria bacterium]